MQPLIAITPGEPAGIGPDLCVQYAQQIKAGAAQKVILIADPDLISSRAQQLGLKILLTEFDPSQADKPLHKHELKIIPVALQKTCQPGILNPNNAEYVLNTLNRAVEGCLNQQFQALVTGPVQKSIINEAGFPFTGHTEYLAKLCQCKTVVMMLSTPGLRVALVTTHLPLADVPKAITKTLLREIITILERDLRNKFGIPSPRILVAGLNPHAGENGHLGREEIDIIEPVMQEFREQGMNLSGPLPADTLFTDKYLSDADAVLAMYHDQGLPVLKYKGFGQAVNITLGLPLIRTSVDHGTALDLAGSGKANINSLMAAIDSATFMANKG